MEWGMASTFAFASADHIFTAAAMLLGRVPAAVLLASPHLNSALPTNIDTDRRSSSLQKRTTKISLLFLPASNPNLLFDSLLYSTYNIIYL
jgi:hypothetical protein